MESREDVRCKMLSGFRLIFYHLGQLLDSHLSVVPQGCLKDSVIRCWNLQSMHSDHVQRSSKHEISSPREKSIMALDI